METLKKTISLTSYDPDKLEAEERSLRKKKPVPGFLIWQTRRNSIQAYMCIILNVANMLHFSRDLIMYGGVVWVSYFTWAVIVGVPMITAEIALGHYINNEIKYVWGMCRIGKGIFWNCIISTIATVLLCHVYLTILLHFAFQINELKLIEYASKVFKSPNKSYANGNQYRSERSYFTLTDDLSDGKTFLYINKNDLWVPSLCLAAICFLMVLINCKGIRSLEKVTALFLLVPYLCAVILAMLVFTLPGAVNYIGRCWHLDWRRLREISVWLVSFKTMVKGFSIGSLSLIFVSVHSDFHDDIMIDVVIIFLNIILNNVLYSITLLGLVGIIDSSMETPAEIVNMQDYVSILLRIVYGLSELPPPKWLWKFLFYSYLIGPAIAQLSLLIASVADVITSLASKLKTNSFYVTTCLCIAFFLLGISFFGIEVLRTPTLDSSFLTIGLLQSVTIFWIYNYERLCTDFHFLMGYKPSLFYQFTWAISPIMFLAMIITEILLLDDHDLLTHNNIYLTVFHIIIYIICALIEIFLLRRKGEGVNIFRPEKSWGPSDPLLRKSRIVFNSRIITKEHIYRQKLYEEQLVKPADITDQNIVQLL